MALPLGKECSMLTLPYCVGRIKRGGRRDSSSGSGRRQPKEPGPRGSPAPAGARPASIAGPAASQAARHKALLILKPLMLQRDAFSGSCLLMVPKLRNANLFRADSFSKGNLPQLLMPCTASIQTTRKHLQGFFCFLFVFVVFFLLLLFSPFFKEAGGTGEFTENLCFL